MKKYQIVDAFGKHMHAGSKATNDCVEILEKLGFEKCLLQREENVSYSALAKMKRQVGYVFKWKQLYNQIEPDSVVVIQNPFRYFQLSRFETLKKLKNQKNVQIISVIHDVDMIRESYKNFKTEKEFKEMIAVADKFIVHNKKMKQWFIDYGISEDKLICLEIFDYLNNEKPDKEITFDKSVQLAGNLSKGKSPYVYKLNELKTKIDLYGVEYTPTEENPENIKYHGAFPAEEIPAKLNKGFGLVWDGTSLDTCDGDTGRYLKFNNPHKLSLYLSSAIPVIIWDQAAEADFVIENNVGIAVSSLREVDEYLENMTEEEYFEKVANAKKIQERLVKGYYLEKAINQTI